MKTYFAQRIAATNISNVTTYFPDNCNELLNISFEYLLDTAFSFSKVQLGSDFQNQNFGFIQLFDFSLFSNSHC
jgi:hypothetical protein